MKPRSTGRKSTLLRSLVVSLLVCGGVAGAFAAAAIGDGEDLDTPRQHGDVWLDAGITAEQAEALASLSPGNAHAPRIVHPPSGAAYPSAFPPPRVQWSDEAASRIYQVTLRAGGADGAVVFRGVTRRKELVPSHAAWDAVREAGAAHVEVVGGLVGPEGRASGTLGVAHASTVSVAPTAVDPDGMLLFGAKLRPPNQPVGTVHLLQMHLRIDALDLERLQHRVVFRSSYGPDATRIHPERQREERGEAYDGGVYGRPQGLPAGGLGPGPGGPNGVEPPRGPEMPARGNGGPGNGGPGNGGPGGFHGPGGPGGDGPDDGFTTTQCVSCHAMSGDGRYVGVFSQAAEEAPPNFDAPNGFLTILSMPERRVMAQLPHAFMPMFNPVNSNLVVYGEVDETIGIKDQQMVRKSDLRVLDLTTGVHRPVPGAAEPDRVENFPFWSPDGQKLTFIRTRRGEMWHGAAGHINVGVVDYNGGLGGTPKDLEGASNNGKSNFLPIYSRDGRWIVFTQADQGFFSQQSADLYIVPAEGGTARKLGCNSDHTESWHRFSPNGGWLGIVTNREDVRRPHIYLARFDSERGTCLPAVQMPIVAGPGAHTHAFSWTPRYDWIEDYELVRTLRR